MDLVEAAVDGARLRFRPILMTSFAFIMGVVPLATAVGASATCRRALGTAVLTGMSTATLVGVILIPCLYVYVQFLLNKMGGDPRKKKHQAPGAPPEASLPAPGVSPAPAEPAQSSVAPPPPVREVAAQVTETVPEAGRPAPVEEAPPAPEARAKPDPKKS